MRIKIEKNVPVPHNRRGPQISEYAKAALVLKVGESFLIDADTHMGARNSVASAMRRLPSHKFCFRPQGSKFRVWRIK